MKRDLKDLKEIVFEVLKPDIRKKQLVRTAKLEDDLGADSLDRIKIFMAVSEHFEIEIREEEEQNLISLADIVNYINNRKSLLPKPNKSQPLSYST